MVLPFLGKLPYNITKWLQAYIKNHLLAYELRTSLIQLSSLIKFKESIPKNLRSDIVYKILHSCCNTTYDEQTERHLLVRSSENLGLTSLNGKRIKNLKRFTINDHILVKGHDANYNDFSILLNESSVFKLHLLQPLLIKKEKTRA